MNIRLLAMVAGLGAIFGGSFLFAVNLTTGRLAFMPDGFLMSTMLSIVVIAIGGFLLFTGMKLKH